MSDPQPPVSSDATDLGRFASFAVATRGRHGLSVPDIHSIDAELEAEAAKDVAAGDVAKG